MNHPVFHPPDSGLHEIPEEGPEYAPRSYIPRVQEPQVNNVRFDHPASDSDSQYLQSRADEPNAPQQSGNQPWLGVLGSSAKFLGKFSFFLLSTASTSLLFFILVLVLAISKSDCVYCSYFGNQGFQMSASGVGSLLDRNYIRNQCDTSAGKSNHVVYMSADMMAVTNKDFSKPLFCGMCLKINGPAGFALARISGTCNNCSLADITVSQQVYSAILGSTPESIDKKIPVMWGPCTS